MSNEATTKRRSPATAAPTPVNLDVIHCAECGAPYSSESFANLEFN